MIKLLIVDDHPVVRDGLRGMLGGDPEFTVVGEAANGAEAVTLTENLGPDVVLMDLRMPGTDGVAAINKLRERGLSARVLVLTTYDTDSDVLPAIEAGATGYLLKDAPREELFRAVRAAARGEAVLSPSVATRLLGQLHLPALREGRLPGVVEYLGYGGGRGLAHEKTLFAQAGYAHLIMDTRGQGSGWSAGDTPDPAAEGGGPAHPGYMTRGILDPATYYYRRVFTDAVRAVEAIRTHPAVDPTRVAVTGGSQGGGITIAAAGLVGDLAGAAPDVPFLCDFPRATTLVDSYPYQEIVRYLKIHRDHVDRVYRTLSYFDGAILGRRATAPGLFLVGLMDEICPPSTVYGAYHWYGGSARKIAEYPYNEHEGGQGFHDAVKLRWLAEALS